MIDPKNTVFTPANSTSFWPIRFYSWLRSFRPAPTAVNAKERWRAILGAAIGVLFAAAFSRLLVGSSALGIWLVAPLGASAVLVFAVPASPLAQPWAVIGGNTISALVGIICARWIPDPALAGAVAVSVAIATMFGLRCLHPPGGAMALIAVLMHAEKFQFAYFPVLINSALLVAAGIAYNTMTGRRYPHVQVIDRKHSTAATRFNSTDLDNVLARYNQVLDVSRDDLESIVQLTEMEALRRRLGEIKCKDIMSHELFVVEFGTYLQDAWSLMRRRRIKALPVIDSARRIIGIITLADFMRYVDIDSHEGMREKLRDFIRRNGLIHSSKPEVVGQIMTQQVRVASADRHIVELMPLFSEDGHHHIPIIGENTKLVGIITQSDFVRALSRSVRSNC